MVKATRKVETIVDLDTYLCVTWADAVVDGNGWQALDAAHNVHECRSVGWLIKETKHHIVLAADISAGAPDELESPGIETNRRIAIPKDWIISRRKAKFGTG